MLAEQVGLFEAQQLGDAVVDETELTFQVEYVDQVGRVIDHVTMQTLRMRQAALDLRLFFLDSGFVERVANRVLEFVEAVGLLENIVGTQAHRLGHLVDRGFAAEHDDGSLYLAVTDEGQHLVARLLRHVQIQDYDFEAALLNQRNRDFTILGFGNVAPFPPQQHAQALARPRIVVHHQEGDGLIETWVFFVESNERIFHGA